MQLLNKKHNGEAESTTLITSLPLLDAYLRGGLPPASLTEVSQLINHHIYSNYYNLDCGTRWSRQNAVLPHDYRHGPFASQLGWFASLAKLSIVLCEVL